MKANKILFSIVTIIFVQSCDCHYRNTQAYVKCLEDNKGNEQICVEIKSKYPQNICEPIDYEPTAKTR